MRLSSFLVLLFAPVVIWSCGGSSGPPGGYNGDDGGTGSDGTITLPDGAVTLPDGGVVDTGSGNDGQPTPDSASNSCTPGLALCDGLNAVQTCKANGMGWDIVVCPMGSQCMNAKCVCTPGTVVCQGNAVYQCGSDGTLHMTVTCGAGTICRNGLCDDLRCPNELQDNGETALPSVGWPRFRHDNRNSGWTPSVVAAMPTLKWKKLIGGTQLNGTGFGLASGPVVNQNDVVFIGGGEQDSGGLYHAFDGATGNVIFTFSGVRGYGWTTPAVRKDGTSYYSTEDGTAYAVNPAGMLAWKLVFGTQDDCSPIVTKDGYVIYGSDNGSLFAMQPTGTQLWTSSTSLGPGEVDAALAETCDGVIYAGGRNGWTALDAQTGNTNWLVPAGGPYNALMSSPVVTQDGTMYGIDSQGGGIAIKENGTVIWQKSLNASGSAATELVHVGAQLFAVLDDGNLYAFDQATGNVVWSKPVGNSVETYKHAGPIVDGNQHIYFNSNDGNLYAFDTSGNPLWKIPHSGISTPGGSGYGTPAIGKDGTIYVPGNDGYLYAFK